VRAAPDVAVVDFMMPAWLCEAEAGGVPGVALVHTLYDRVAAGILTAFTTLDDINAQRRALELETVADASELLDRAARVIVTAPRELDTGAPANGRHVGAILEEPGPDDAWLPPTGDDPLVVVSLGTTPGLNEEPVAQRTLDAIADLPVRAVVNVSEHLDASALRLPSNASVEGYVRHAAVMPHASAVVTHAGLGTIVAALAHGLPLVCLPLGRDQPHNAERVEAVGAGVALPTDASAGEIGAALERVVDQPSFTSSAQPFRDEYDPRAQRAIEELEAIV
jgi:MGT family glycosyltransferase